ncbi:hypothetical protein RJ639_013791 [Escallonia herrerae]|uniref:Protein FAR1-RELATED SEQUENCE n=1 Tax=Escallonia herrerae TaxID=1293975 RepID=A0AA89AM74_9ASTE|nr:hypothetical protein RJ639_013791 [Escallonia herrerae]
MESCVIAGSSNLEPQDDMEFDSNEAAYDFYKEYAKSVGFGTAKLSSRRSRASKEFIDAKFSCIRYGSKQQSDDAINPRPSPKIGCKASMHVKRRPTGKWYIHSMVKEHNHDLLPAQAHFFRSHRSIDPLKNDAKVRRRKILAAVSKQYGAYQYTGSLENYIRNQHERGRNLTLEEGDAQLLLDLFVHMQEENPKFFYAVDLNEEHRLRNVFWVDAKGMDDYSNFSDVVSFDTTYVMNKYKLPIVLLVGVNQHTQPTLFGCAMIADETVYSFVWLMQTWCLSMGGRAPRVMLTDQNVAIKAAIAAVFPDTQQSYSLWHVLEKIPRQLDYLSMWYDTFMAKLNKCICRSLTEEQFEKRWWKLIGRFNLREDEWFQSLYEDRKFWVPTFSRDISFAGLSTASRSESLNSFFDKYVHSESSLKDFVEQYKAVLQDRYEEQAKADFDAWHETPELKSPSPFEKQMSLVYTHEIFKNFQVEVLGAAACHLKKEREDESTVIYSVKDFEDNQDYSVEWNESKSEIGCSCRSFEYKGYLCRHAVVVLQMSGVFSIPFRYILQRWTNAATSRHSISERVDEVQSKVRRYNDLCRRAIILGEEGSLSQESYHIALGAIKDALKQCSDVNNSTENVLRPDIMVPLTTLDVEEEHQARTITAKEQVPSFIMNKTSKASKRMGSVKEKPSDDNDANKKGKDLLQVRPIHLHDAVPPNVQNVVPTMFHNVPSTQFHHAASTNMQDAHLPR